MPLLTWRPVSNSYDAIIIDVNFSICRPSSSREPRAECQLKLKRGRLMTANINFIPGGGGGHFMVIFYDETLPDK